MAATVEQGPEGINAGDLVVLVEPLLLDSGERMSWIVPEPVAFYLAYAKQQLDRGVSKRRNVMGNLFRRDDGQLAPLSESAALDSIESLSAAVVFSFFAVEALGNAAIDQLPADAEITYGGRTYDKAAMLGLGIETKYKQVVPLADPCRAIAGDAPTWARFLHLKALRNELVHVKGRGYVADEKRQSPFAKLLLGRGDGCVADAVAVADATWPDYVNDRVRARLAN